MTDLPDLAGPDLWSVADGPVLSRASIQVAMQHVHHDNVHHDGARVRTRAAALVRGVLPVPAGSAHRWSAESPYLYTLLISLYAGDELLEVIATLIASLITLDGPPPPVPQRRAARGDCHP